MGLERRRHRGRVVADLDDIDAVRSPPFAAVEFQRQPIRQPADSGDRDLLALQIGDIVDRRIRRHENAEKRDRRRDIAHSQLGRALGDQGHLRPAADADIDAASEHRLMHLCRALKGDDLHIDPVLGKNAGLHPDVERQHRRRRQCRFTDGEFFGGVCGRYDK
jgi:hypothetical protein